MVDERPEPGDVGTAAVEMAAPSVRLFAPGTEIGRRYEVHGVLGMGGSAVVYEAFDRELKRRVALKVLRTDRTSEASLKRFRHEVAIARDAAGSRLVRVFDIGQSGGTVFLTMELVEGESLRELLSRGPLAPERAVGIGTEVLHALADLHRLGIVHRDVKPGNILIAATGEVKLADFGLARHWEGAETRVTEPEGLVGTVEYLSPEQALGDLLDARSDLYSFGVVLFEMLAGKVPLRGDSAIGTIVAHIRQEPPDVRKVRPKAPTWLAGVVARLLAKDRERRYTTADDVLADLGARRARRAPRRLSRRFVLGGAAAFLAALILLALVPVFPWNQPRLSRLVPDGAGGVQALDGEGRLLWRRPDAESGRSVALVRLAEGRTAAVAVRGGLTEPKKALEILDPSTGRTLSEMPLPDPADTFAGFANTYIPGAVLAFDVEGDGVDEVAVTLANSPLFPSATYVCDLANRRVLAAFHGSGHHYAAAAADVDGDGRKELVLAGYNNRMGYSGAVAAFRVPKDGGILTGGTELPFAESPDRPTWEGWSPHLAWYALVPLAAVGGRASISVDTTGGVLGIGPFGPRRVELALDGFPPGPRERGEERRRALAREEAYVHLRETARLGETGDPAEGLAEAERALERSRAAGDVPLTQWASRVRAKAFLDAGRPADADSAWVSSFERHGEPAPVALEAGRAFHLKGELDRAISWYRRGLGGRGSHARGGHHPRDLLGGEVLALGETGRWEDAAIEIDRFEAAYPLLVSDAAVLRGYVAWRTLRRPRRLEGRKDEPGLIRYWGLEIRRVLGDAPATLLGEVDRLGREVEDVAPLLASLRAELLFDTGRVAEGKALAAEAVADATREAKGDVGIRAHLALVAERARRRGVLSAEPAEPPGRRVSRR
ncbi:MAG: serine/threonine protein kinase [Holophagales bacterium]|nr:serine/threonine protein kinase [Holophagales bacterium]